MRDCGTPRIGFCRALPTTLRKQRYAVQLRAEGHKIKVECRMSNEHGRGTSTQY
nr:MAG TPA: hypothetical protein [Caudoviricetes sp.]